MSGRVVMSAYYVSGAVLPNIAIMFTHPFDQTTYSFAGIVITACLAAYAVNDIG